MLFKDFFFSFKNIHINFLEKKEIFKFFRVGISILYKFFILDLIMAYNVWFIIWPNQKKVLGMVECAPEEKAKSARTAMLFSRTNTLLSLPMLLCMVMAQNLY